MAKKTMKIRTKKSTHTSRLFEGLPVVDANEDIDLVIKKSDVANSKKKDPNNCAAAMAGRREFQTDVRVFISRTYIKDKEKKRWVRFITPEGISREITSFDRGASFEPGEFTLKAIPDSQRRGYKPTGPKLGKGKKKRKKHLTTNVRINAKEY